MKVEIQIFSCRVAISKQMSYDGLFVILQKIVLNAVFLRYFKKAWQSFVIQIIMRFNNNEFCLESFPTVFPKF